MSSEKNPPAFPTQYDTDWVASGMTLRDWFAGQAIGAAWTAAMEFSRSPETPEAFAAKQAYAIADAMLAARSENNGE